VTRFPDTFLWGAATAGHQVEGGNINADCWPLEWTLNSGFLEPSGDACDHYHRYPQDIELMRDLGFNAYRFSLEWSRIEPEPGYFSVAAIEHYGRMIECCVAANITPVVTLNHFTLPRWMAERGGWTSPESPDRFAEYANQVVIRLGDLLPWVCTLNEPNLIAMVLATGILAMGDPEHTDDTGATLAGSPSESPIFDRKRSNGGAGGTPSTYRMGLITGDLQIMGTAHRQAREAIKAGSPRSKVGWTLALVDLQESDGGGPQLQTARKEGQTDWLEVSSEDDFVGVQTYSRNLIGPEGAVQPPKGAATMQTGWEVYPQALEHTVRLAAACAKVPVLVTENGMATNDDEARLAYTQTALEGLARCVDDGIDVRGYLHWTLLDNFEWTAGFTKTFGLIGVDRRTFERTVKPSARWLGDVAKRNGLV